MPRSLRTGSIACLAADDHARQQIIVSGQVLGGRMQHVVDAVLDGLGVVRCRQRRIDQRLDAMTRSDGREPIEVHDTQVRIRGRFADQQSRPLVDRRFHRVVIARLDLVGHDAESRHVLDAEFATAMVTLVEENHFVTGVELRHQQSDDGGHAGREQHGLFASLERGKFPLDNPFSRVAVATVLLAGQILLDIVQQRLRVGERVRGRTHDGVRHGIGQLLPLFAGMHSQRRRTAVAREIGFVISLRGTGGEGAMLTEVLQFTVSRRRRLRDTSRRCCAS